MNFLEQLYQEHRQMKTMPSPDEIYNLMNNLLGILFPELSHQEYQNFRALEHDYNKVRLQVSQVLNALESQLKATAKVVETEFFKFLPIIYQQLLSDAQAISDGDPAATSRREVIRTYPGFFAVAVYRIAHQFYRLDVPLLPRILTEYAHSKTGVDIHPAAKIGANFCIDHGTGIVIGATSTIGNNVKIYQGVTLGALSVEKRLASTKRHPTIEDNTVIYAGATILGGDTNIGHNSIIGGNVWVMKSIPPYSRVYYDNSKVQVKKQKLIAKD
ncbi:MAG: serine O-acetyltransferase EpsC [Bacteroidota bacterium]